MTSGPAFFTPRTLAAHLGVSRAWVYEKTALNLIPHAKLGQHLRYDPVKIAAWVEGQSSDGSGPQARRRTA